MHLITLEHHLPPYVTSLQCIIDLLVQIFYVSVMNPMEEVFHIWSLYTFQSFCVSFCGRMDMCLWV